ncbi:DEAD/DEAH box helicase [Faecalimonas sp.]
MENIIDELESLKTITYEDSFRFATKCAQLLGAGDEESIQDAQKNIVFILDRLDDLPDETYEIWSDIIESAGFYPYINREENLSLTSLADQIRYYSFSSSYLENLILHKDQKRLSELLKSGKNVVASAPTSFGKSLLIEELVASNQYKNIVVIQPTLALLDETRIKLKKYSSDYKIVVRTAQTPSEDNKGNLFLLTAERVMEYDNLPQIDLLIIDEFYKLSLKRIDDRADTLNNAFLKVMRYGKPQFYLLGPNIGGITKGFEEKYDAIFFKTSFSLVGCRVSDISSKIDTTVSSRKQDEQKQQLLFELLDSLETTQTIVYCKSPSRARKIARNYLLYLKDKNVVGTNNLPLIEWITKNVSDKWSLVDTLKYGIAVHDGSLQKHIGNSVIQYFNTGKLRCIFCTSTIIEGVNTSAKNVVIFDERKGNKSIDYFDYSNIKGRAGRMMEHYVGNVFSFVPEPKKNELIVDIPFIEQDKNILTDEILVNIDEEDVQPQVKDRFEQLNQIPPDLLSILKQNGTNINGQMSIYYALERDILTKQKLITWTQMPSYNAMVYILSLADENIFDFKNEHGVISIKQLTFLLNTYREKKTIMSIVKSKYNYKLKNRKTKPSDEENMALIDAAIEEAFHVYKHWFQYKVPKAFRVVDSIQRYVCEKHGIKAGSYSFYVQQLENDFVPERLSILIEYGIPNTTILKIQQMIPSDLSDEEIVAYIKEHKDTICKDLTDYEIERISSEL